MSEPAISVRNVVKLYTRRGQPTVRAIDGLTFDVARGAIFGLLGPNGAGKTTLLRILSTLVRPTSGTATVPTASAVFGATVLTLVQVLSGVARWSLP